MQFYCLKSTATTSSHKSASQQEIKEEKKTKTKEKKKTIKSIIFKREVISLFVPGLDVG